MAHTDPAHWQISIRGHVQGVGFRPFVCALARSLDLRGHVRNHRVGVEIDVAGPDATLAHFVQRLRDAAPPAARITDLQQQPAPSAARAALPHPFAIDASRPDRESTALQIDPTTDLTIPVQPDAATCTDCLRDLFDPSDRRYLYPFTTCSACGPRYSISESLPFDRARTTMRDFPPCAACQAEYEDPRDRRCHAQTIACPACGPRLTLRDATGQDLAHAHDALLATAAALQSGRIVAVLGVGGYHLMCDATAAAAVARLRIRRGRPDKPLALMVRTLSDARAVAPVDDIAAGQLTSPAAPIVLLPRPASLFIAPDVAPAVATLGIVLAYTPLHHLLLSLVGRPLVATSGNRSDEPMQHQPADAHTALASIADLFLDHDRRIVHPVDDSIVRVIGEGPVVLRRARGYVPATLPLPLPCAQPVLAAGGHLKAAIAIAAGRTLQLGPHIGNLDSPRSRSALQSQIDHLPSYLGIATPRVWAADAHPDSFSSGLRTPDGRPPHPVSHHRAHALAGIVDRALVPPLVAVTWDGLGAGPDGTLWGGEFLRFDTLHNPQRIAHLRPFPLPGGDAAAREPRRSALGLLYALHGPSLFAPQGAPPPLRRLFSDAEWATLRVALTQRVNTPTCSSVGRLLDAVAALCGLCHFPDRPQPHRLTYEGQAAMSLEALALQPHAVPTAAQQAHYTLPLSGSGPDAPSPWQLDPAPLCAALLRDLEGGVPPASVAHAVHIALCQAIAAVVRRSGLSQVLLTGGVFQNRLLCEATRDRLAPHGVAVHLHAHVPPGDGGLAVGQALAAALDGADAVR